MLRPGTMSRRPGSRSATNPSPSTTIRDAVEAQPTRRKVPLRWSPSRTRSPVAAVSGPDGIDSPAVASSQAASQVSASGTDAA